MSQWEWIWELLIDAGRFSEARVWSGRRKRHVLANTEGSELLVTYFQPECTRYTVTGEKLYQFMFYQVFRDQKTSHKHPGVFDELDYDRLGEKYLAILDDNDGTIIGHETEILEALEPRNPLGFSSVSTYRSAVRKLYDYQAEEGNGSNSLHWDTQICTRSVKNLLKIVQVSTTNMKRIWQYKSNQ